jgi:hypothetical protein
MSKPLTKSTIVELANDLISKAKKKKKNMIDGKAMDF